MKFSFLILPNKTKRAYPIIDFLEKNHLGMFTIFSICIVIVWAYGFINHNIFEEWDGVLQYYSAMEIPRRGEYSGWASHFWPPLFPTLLIGDSPLLSGKIVSSCAGIIITLSSFLFLSCFQLSLFTKLLVVAAILSNKIFLMSFFSVENHALETAFYILSISLFLWYLKKKNYFFIGLCAVAVSLAGLTRYTSYSLALAIFLFLVLYKPNIKKFAHAALFSAIFVFISALWWIPNYIQNGSPLATWQYMNIGKAVHPQGASLWWWLNQAKYRSSFQVISDFPLEYTVNFFNNILKSLKLLIFNISGFPLLGIILLTLVIKNSLNDQHISKYKSEILFLLVSCLIYILLCSNAFIFKEALEPIILVASLTILGYLAIRSNTKSIIICFFVTSANLATSIYAVHSYINTQRADDDGQLASYIEINKILKKEPDIQEKVVMSTHPARAFYSGSQWVMMPLAGYRNLCDIVEFNYPNTIKEYVPKIPVNLPKNKLKPDYLIIENKLTKKLPLMGLPSFYNLESCNAKLELIFNHKNTNVFKVNRFNPH